MALAFTKYNDFGLPIMKTQISSEQPCLNPIENYQGANTAFFYPEMARAVNKCNVLVRD